MSVEDSLEEIETDEDPEDPLERIENERKKLCIVYNLGVTQISLEKYLLEIGFLLLHIEVLEHRNHLLRTQRDKDLAEDTDELEK